MTKKNKQNNGKKAKPAAPHNSAKKLARFMRRAPITTTNKGTNTVTLSQIVATIPVDHTSSWKLMKIPMSCIDITGIKVQRQLWQFYQPLRIAITVQSNFGRNSGGGYMIGYVPDSADDFTTRDDAMRALSAGLRHTASTLPSSSNLLITHDDIRKATSRENFYTDASADIRMSQCGNIFILLNAAPAEGNSSTLSVNLEVTMKFTGPTVLPSDTGRMTQGNLPDDFSQISKIVGLFLDSTLNKNQPSLADVRAVFPQLPATGTQVIEILGSTYAYNRGDADVLHGRYILYDSQGDGRSCYFIPIHKVKISGGDGYKFVLESDKVDQDDYYQTCLAKGVKYQFVCETVAELNKQHGHQVSSRKLDVDGNRTGEEYVTTYYNDNAPFPTRSVVNVNQAQLDEQTNAIRSAVQDAATITDTGIGELEETITAEFGASRAHAIEQNALTQSHITAAHVLTRTEARAEAAILGTEIAGVAGEVGGVIRQVGNLASEIEVQDQQASNVRTSIFNQVDGQSHKEIASLITGKQLNQYDLIFSQLQTMSAEYNADPESEAFRDSLNLILSAFQLPEVQPEFDATISVDDLKTNFSNGRLFAYHGSAHPDAQAWPNFYNLGTNQFPIENAVGLYIRTQYNDVVNTYPVYTYLKVVGFEADVLQLDALVESRTHNEVDDWNLHYSFQTKPITSYKSEKIQIFINTEPRVSDLLMNGI